MKKVIVLIAVMMTYITAAAAEKDNCYKDNIAGAEIYVCSVKDNNLTTKILLSSDKEVIDYNNKVNPKGYIENKHNVMIIKKGKYNILVDTGFADTVNSLKNALKTSGLEVKDITHIILTHAHFDHIGGLVQNEKAVFPNADIYINEKEYNYFCKSDLSRVSGSAKKNMENVRNILSKYNGRIKYYKEGIIDNNIKEITAVAAYGHTPGHSLINIKDKNKNLLFIADLMHIYNVQIKYPETAVSFDMDKNAAVKKREEILKKYKGTNTQITGSHTPFSAPVLWEK